MSDSANLDVVRRLTAAIFECDPAELTAETRLMLDLPCESIDLLELSTGLARACGVNMNDNAAFLRSLEFHFARLQREGHTEAAEIAALCGPEFPHLAQERLTGLAAAWLVGENGPQLSLGDVAAYLDHARRG